MSQEVLRSRKPPVPPIWDSRTATWAREATPRLRWPARAACSRRHGLSACRTARTSRPTSTSTPVAFSRRPTSSTTPALDGRGRAARNSMCRSTAAHGARRTTSVCTTPSILRIAPRRTLSSVRRAVQCSTPTTPLSTSMRRSWRRPERRSSRSRCLRTPISWRAPISGQPASQSRGAAWARRRSLRLTMMPEGCAAM